MKLAIVRRKMVWWPTWLGWFVIVTLPLLAGLWCYVFAESFLALDKPLKDATVLVVEGWIGLEGLAEAKAEFSRGGYEVMVAAGVQTNGRWMLTQDNYAEMAQRELLRLGTPNERVLLARSADSERGRTFEMAMGVKRVLSEAGLTPKAINVFTLGAHARRSRMVYAKVLGPNLRVGSIAWVTREDRTRPWWESSERAKELINETVGYLYELAANSGRGWQAHKS